MREIIDKINKHKIIGLKTDCKYFSNVGNLCSRVANGMMRCDEYLECEFKYIDALEEENGNLKQQLEIDKNQINCFIEENERLKEELASFMNGDYCAEGCKKMNNAFCDVHKGILDENEKLKQYLLNIGMVIEELEQQYDDIKDFTEIKEIKEILREVNQ